MVLFSDAKTFNGTIIESMPNAPMIAIDVFISKLQKRLLSFVLQYFIKFPMSEPERFLEETTSGPRVVIFLCLFVNVWLWE
jgi:hypothetical protein